MAVRPRFDPKRALIVARGFIFAGRTYAVGEPFPHPDDGPFATRMLARQYEARVVNMTEPEANDPISMTGPAGGRYAISAPWFETPLVIRGKVNAEKALAEVREEGAPLGWIDGGTEVEIEQTDENLFQVTAPWLDQPEQIEGRAAAEKRQLELHKAGAPQEGGEGDAGENTGEQGGENPADPDAAGPEGEIAPAQGEDGGQGGDAQAGPPEGADETTPATDGASAPVTVPPVTSEHTGGGWYTISAPWLSEPQRVQGGDAADARRLEIEEAGPPEGWTPVSE